MTTCSTPECDRPTVGRGLCAKHYQKARYHGLDETVPRPTHACMVCGNDLPAGRRYGAMYCSKPCNEKAAYLRRTAIRRQQRIPNCLQCGADLTNHRLDAKFCSDRHQQDYHNAAIAARRLTTKTARPCLFCGKSIPAEAFVSRTYCSKRCEIRGRRAKTYGLTQAELDALLEQHGVCAICQSTDWGKKGPQVDHDHATGAVRAVLCINCNRGLGLFKDDPARLRAAADYLDNHI